MAVNTKHIRQYIEKRAGVVSDVGLSLPVGAIPGVGEAAGFAGGVGAYVAPAPALSTLNNYDKNPALSLLPCVGPWRLGRRRKALRNLLKDPSQSFNIKWSEELGLLSSTAIGLPFLPIAMLAHAGGALLAAVTPRRTLAEQQAYENSSSAAIQNSVVPGFAVYNKFKSLGAAKNLYGKNEEQVQQELEDEKKKKKDSEEQEKSSAAKEPVTSKPPQSKLPAAQRGEPQAISGSNAGINPWTVISNAVGKTSPRVQELVGYRSSEPAPQLKQPKGFTYRASNGKPPMPEMPSKKR